MMSISLQEFAQNVRRQTYLLVRAYEFCDRFCLEQHGISASQAYSLIAFPTVGTITMNELSEKMALANSTMTRFVDQLVQKDLVRRENDPEDRRVVRVSLTQTGQELQKKLESSLQEFFELALKDIPVQERSEMTHQMERLNQAILSTLRGCCDIRISL
jgi:DNA-binding MarR family transcriptional regulator